MERNAGLFFVSVVRVRGSCCAEVIVTKLATSQFCVDIFRRFTTTVVLVLMEGEKSSRHQLEGLASIALLVYYIK